MRTTCEWHNCSNEALCRSGNFGNKLVCATHFAITNGPEWNEERVREALGRSEEQFYPIVTEFQQLIADQAAEFLERLIMKDPSWKTGSIIEDETGDGWHILLGEFIAWLTEEYNGEEHPDKGETQ